jgi:hypothetical protein
MSAFLEALNTSVGTEINTVPEVYVRGAAEGRESQTYSAYPEPRLSQGAKLDGHRPIFPDSDTGGATTGA